MRHPCRLIAAIIATSLPAPAQIPAFPGAEGFGAHATGGRGGDVYTVTNLASSGAGSLAEGIATAPASGRTIVFAVSGYIHVPGSNLRIVRPGITIAGQTAPGDGIGLKDGTLRITGNNTVIRNLRIRHGKNGGGGDCLNVDSTAHDSIIDHVSMQFSTDENISFFNSSLDNFTMQSSLSAWGLESHNAGGLWDLEDGSCIDSLWAHHHTRNPKARPYGLLEWVNNVSFDWGIGFIMGDSTTPANWKANVIGSYFLSPPSYTDSYALEKATVDRNGNPNFSLWLDNCLHDSDGDGLLNGTDKGYAIVRGSGFSPGDPPGANRYVKAAGAFTGAAGNIAVTADDPLTAYKKVVSQTGAVRMSANHPGPLRDEVDTILFINVVNQLHSRISRESDLAVSNSGFGTLVSTPPPTDTDLDGMPDFWESALGFSSTMQNHNTVFGSTAGTFFPPGTPVGYTQLEEYLHFLSIPHGTVAKNSSGAPSSITIDLRKYTGGFSNSPEFSISGVHGGSVRQFASNGTTPSAVGPIITFTPTLDFSGRAGFDFEVDDGSTWTQPFALLVTVLSLPRDITWIGGLNGNAWNTATANWQDNGAGSTTFNDGDNTLFDDRGSAATIPVDGTRHPNSVTVTGIQDYRFSGSGSLDVASTFTKASDTNLTLDSTVSTGNGTFLNGGETILNDPATLAGGAIHFTGGSTLTSTHSSYFTLPPDLQVQSGATANINFSQRADVEGSLSGGGTFNIFSPSTLGTEGRVYLKGASAGCTGNVRLSGGATAAGNGGRISCQANGGSFDGFPDARVQLSGIDVFTANHSLGNTYQVGELSGDASSRLRGNHQPGGGATIWSVGGLDSDATFDGSVMDGLASITHFDKVGSGTLTLSGTSTHSGNTSVFGGTLDIPGSLANATVFVDGGCTLTGSGSISRTVLIRDGGTLAGSLEIGGLVTLESGATMAPDLDDITAAGGIDILGNQLFFDLSASPAGNNGQIVVTGGSADMTGENTFHINAREGVLGAGSYRLIACAGGVPLNRVGTMNMYIDMDVPADIRQSFSINRTSSGMPGGNVWLQVTGDAGSMLWQGNGGPNWDLNTTSNFSGGPGGDNKFYNLDEVMFTDAASSGTVTLAGELQPRAMIVGNNSLAYTMGGSGHLAGPMTLIKNGGGILTLANTALNRFSGGTLVNDGEIVLGSDFANANALGTGPITFAGGTLTMHDDAGSYNSQTYHFDVPAGQTGTFHADSRCDIHGTLVGGGTFNVRAPWLRTTLYSDWSAFAGQLNVTTDGNGGELRMGTSYAFPGFPNASVDLADKVSLYYSGTLSQGVGTTVPIGALSGGSMATLRGGPASSGDRLLIYRIGGLGTDSTFAGTIAESDPAVTHTTIIKTGAGSWTLGGSSEWNGGTAVEQGTLVISGSVTSVLEVDVDPGATLELLNGSLSSDAVNIAPGATLVGNGTVNGTLNNDGLVSCPSGTLALNGPVVNNGTARLSSGAVLAATGEFINNGLLDLLTADGEIPANLVNNGTVIDSGDLRLTGFEISGNDVVLSLLTHDSHTYQLQWSPDLAAGSWSDVGSPVAGDGSEKPFTHPGGAATGRRFYRIAVAP